MDSNSLNKYVANAVPFCSPIWCKIAAICHFKNLHTQNMSQLFNNAMKLVWSKYLGIIQKYQFHSFSQVGGKMNIAI